MSRLREPERRQANDKGSAMVFFDRFIDYMPALRCSSVEATGRIITKQFVKDASFGDCEMFIEYEFTDARGILVVGRFVGTESSFHSVGVGQRIKIRYLESNSNRNAPTDSLGIITPIE
jgi:hypothetical protein